MNKKILIEVSLYDQWKDTGNELWADRSCSICALKTMLVFEDSKNSELKIMGLINEGLKLNGYMESIGWKHQALVDLARNHGVTLRYQKEFFAGDGKLLGLDLINKNILKGRPVIASVLNRTKNGGHMVVIHGLEARGNNIQDYFILDPDSRDKNRYSLDREEFLSIWRGGLLWLG